MFTYFYIILIIFTISLSGASHLKNNGIFPKNFIFGAATSAYQIEGAWNADGKGQSIWDEFVHRSPSPIANNETGDVACDSYHRWKEDVHLVSNIGMQYYRFSISWSRLFPSGYANEKINEAGLKYYKKLIQEVIKRGLIPVVTLFHWDLPQKLYQDGISWTNPAIVNAFVNYSREVIKHFPEVGATGKWATLNEPRMHCRNSYGLGVFAPGLQENGILDYQCFYVMLKAHAAVYRMYKKEFPHYKAPMSIVLDCQWAEPATKKPEDIAAAERQLTFECGIFFHPLFVGDWPSLVVERVAERSKKEGYKKSRLPKFTQEEIDFIRGTHDFLAFNHYYTFLVADEPEAPYNRTALENDVRAYNSKSPDWPVSSINWNIVPWGARKVLNYLKQQYGDHEMLITEIGVADDGSSLNDHLRINFYHDYFCEILEAMQIDRVKVIGISVWSLMDNFEWTEGYTPRFGLYYVNRNGTKLSRTPKKSVSFFQKLSATKRLDCSNYNGVSPSLGQYRKNRNSYGARSNRISKNNLYAV
uniref:Glycoside hydrolase family 1 n=1 Tax=Phyllotreta striolata TaxID=444603 RepID=A0A059UAD4_PHYSR|nr:glycoside hydrolase family 1 [Phyllotreta striolata]